MSLFAELKRRNVIRVGIAYAIASWVLLQITDVISPLLELPVWAPKLIFVILAVGFVPALIFAWAFELTPEGLKKEKDVDRSQSITRITGRKLDFIIIGVLVIAVGLLLADKFAGQPDETAVSTAKSIAVLPFVNMSSDTEQEFFSDGITEEILNSLAAVKELKVAGRSSSFAFKGQNQDLRRIGDMLGVEHILEGSVRKSGSTVRITAQLIQVDDGFHLWSETYDRELTDVFAIQDEIATEILRQLKAKLLDEEMAVLVSQATTPEVYDLYLLAKNRIYGRTRSLLESALALLNQAIALDAKYAPAYAQRGIVTLLLSDQNYGTIPRAEAQQQGKRFIDKALELDPLLAEAWAGLGLYHTDRVSEHELAMHALTKALELNPSLIDASNWLYIVLQDTGDMRGSLQLIENMTARDPFYRPAFASAVQTFNQFGMTDKALALIEQYRQYDPQDPVLFHAEAVHYFSSGKAAEGLPLAQRALELAPTDAVVQFAYSIGLRQTLQLEKLANEGQYGAEVNALDAIGRREEAFAAALKYAGEGTPGPLFALYNRAGRNQELISYLEERWPALDEFQADNPHNGFGYSLMVEVASAYSHTGDVQKFHDALLRVENALAYLAEQGINSAGFMFERAKLFALGGDYDMALTELENAVQRGLLTYAPLARFNPLFQPLQDDPRFVALESAMVQHMNTEREVLGLAPIDPATQFWQ